MPAFHRLNILNHDLRSVVRVVSLDFYHIYSPCCLSDVVRRAREEMIQCWRKAESLRRLPLAQDNEGLYIELAHPDLARTHVPLVSLYG